MRSTSRIRLQACRRVNGLPRVPWRAAGEHAILSMDEVAAAAADGVRLVLAQFGGLLSYSVHDAEPVKEYKL